MQKPILHPTLSTFNAHPRDAHIIFEEVGHKYTITVDPDSAYTSVTTWNHSHFPKFDADGVIASMMRGRNWNENNKYWGKTAEQIKQQWADNASSVSGAGTDMHYNIECFMNHPTMKPPYTHKQLLDDYYQTVSEPDRDQTPEWNYFLKYAEDLPDFTPYRTEWTIYDEELKLAGSIDMVYQKPDGSLMIYDWKRCKDITKINTFNKYATTQCICQYPDSNFWHYSLQLNTYKAILQKKYGMQVDELCLVRLHPDSEEYELLPIPDLSEDVADLFALRKKDVENGTHIIVKH